MMMLDARGDSRRFGFSLIEVLAAVMIAATVATIAISQFRPHGDRGHNGACQLNCQTIQVEVDRYVDVVGSLPSSDLRQLTAPEHWGSPIPNCPASGSALGIDRDGQVTCPSHP